MEKVNYRNMVVLVQWDLLSIIVTLRNCSTIS